MKYVYFLLIILLSNVTFGQINYETYSQKSSKKKVVNIKDADMGFAASIHSKEAPNPDGDSYRSFLAQQKIKQRANYPIKKNAGSYKTTESAQPPILGRQTNMYRVFASGTVMDFIGGTPNDNTMAISNNDLLITGINSVIWAYDYTRDTIVFPNSAVSLAAIADEPGFNNRYFDPKLIYDPDYDRFILIFLKNNDPETNAIIACFSTTNSPLDPWNVYFIDGNPLDNNRWTDYPAISITKDELFITGNLIIPDVSWQVGFDGSIIWQIDKEAGFKGEEILDMELYAKVSHNGKLVRNLHAVRGAEGIAEKPYFLSNRNFDLENDTIFVAHLTGTQNDPNTKLIVDYGVSDVKYGMPPNGRQADTDTTDPTGGLQTNDARVLGAFLLNDKIQFVANTINPETGFSAIYHGHIESPSSLPQIKGKIIGHETLDYGYPNIVFAGVKNCEQQAIIAFNYSSFDDFPGVGAVYFDNEGNYSPLLRVKDGENYIDRTNYTPGPYERWGDYFGLQRKFNKPGSVYATGYHGNANKLNATHVFEMFSPETDTTSSRIVWEDQRLYPNPTNYEVNVDFFTSKEQKVTVVLSDMNGRVVNTIIESNTCSGQNTLVFYPTTLKAGTYVVHIYDQNDQEIVTKKFVKF